jgi:hypothetical protein
MRTIAIPFCGAGGLVSQLPRALRAAIAIALGSAALCGGFVHVVAADDPLAGAFRPPASLANDLGTYRSPLHFEAGRPVRTPAEWRERRDELLKYWRRALGQWPAPIERPAIATLGTATREGYAERRVRFRVASDRVTEGYLLVPSGAGPFPAALVVFYEPETSIGRGKPLRDFGHQLTRRGFVTLSIGFDPRVIDPATSGINLQPLGYLAYVASNAYNALAGLPQVDRTRVAVLGHSYGGKWALFASCLDERFACGVWSDPGIVFDETRANVNYWEPWYLGWEPGRSRTPGLIAAGNPRTGAYRELVAAGRDLHELHALMAPRPFLVSGGSEDPPERWKALNHTVAVNRLLGAANRVAITNRAGHEPTAESNEQIYVFLEHALEPGPAARAPTGSKSP